MFHHWNNYVPMLSHHLYDWMQSPSGCSLEHTVFLPLSSKCCHFLYYSLTIFQGRVESSRTHLSTELREKDFSKAGGNPVSKYKTQQEFPSSPYKRNERHHVGFPGNLEGKNPPAMQVTCVCCLGQEDKGAVWEMTTTQQQTADEGFEGRRKDRCRDGRARRGIFDITFFSCSFFFSFVNVFILIRGYL